MRVRFVYGVGEIGVDDDAIHVAHDEQRRVLQVGSILQQLIVGFVEIGVLAFVLPAEEAFLPDISPAMTALLLVGAGLESE